MIRYEIQARNQGETSWHTIFWDTSERRVRDVFVAHPRYPKRSYRLVRVKTEVIT